MSKIAILVTSIAVGLSALAFTAVTGDAPSMALASAASERDTTRSGATGVAAPDSSELVARGEYLVHHVAMCVQCHSPREKDGTLIEQELFHGGPVPVDGPDWTDRWAFDAPDLVTLARTRPNYVVTVLVTGVRPDGTNPKRPMPPFRLEVDDARAVVEYLHTRE